MVLSGSSVCTWRDVGASWGISGWELIESTKIGPSCKSVKSNSIALAILFLLLLRHRGFQRDSELLILDEQLTHPLLQTPQMVLPFFRSSRWFFILRSCDDLTRHTLQRRSGFFCRIAEWLFTLPGVHDVSNTNGHHCHNGASLAPAGAVVL